MFRPVALPALLAVGAFLLALSSRAEENGTPLLPSDRPIEQVVDHYLDAALRAEKITPNPTADDATLVRRLTLDLAGRIPTIAELDAYLASSEPDKKVQ